MNFIAHRVNTIDELKKVPHQFGVELDLRDQNESLILSHDPFQGGESFEEYLEYYNHGTLILNIKSERIEHQIQKLLHKYSITDYFFLDSSFPMIYLLSSQGENNIALRFSEFEAIETVISMKGKAKWVWVDCFTKLPINHDIYLKLKNAGFKLCLVSPELQNRESDIEKYKAYLLDNNILFDAICTKMHNIKKWK